MPKVSQEYLDGRRRQILDAAMECFSEKGFHQTTMKNIVAASGLSPGAIYNYFSGKDEIVDAIALDRHERETTVLRGALGGDGTEDDLRALARQFFTSFAAREHQTMRRVGVEVWAEALRNPRVLATVRRGVEEPVKVLMRIILASVHRGELPARVDPEGLARVMVAIFQGFVLQQAWNPKVDSERYLGAVEFLIESMTRAAEE